MFRQSGQNEPDLDIKMQFLTKDRQIISDPIFFEDDIVLILVKINNNGAEHKALELSFLQHIRRSLFILDS